MLPEMPKMTAREHAAKFARECLTPAEGNTPVAELPRAYGAWCRSSGLAPFATREIGLKLASLFERNKIEIIEIGGARCIAGAQLRENRWPALGPVAIGVQA